MAVYSQNGWLANNRSVIKSYNVVGGKVAVRQGDVSVILLFILEYLSALEKPMWPGIWGYAERMIRGSSRTVSNHASGTSVDWNAPKHWLGERDTWSFVNVQRIRALLRFLDGVVRWGGDYTGRADEMHFEINTSSSRRVKAVADKIRALRAAGWQPGSLALSVSELGGAQADPTPSRPSTPQPVPTDWMEKIVATLPTLREGDSGAQVKNAQALLMALGILWTQSDVDGEFGPKTKNAVAEFQKRKGLTRDGVVGPNTWTRLLLG